MTNKSVKFSQNDNGLFMIGETDKAYMKLGPIDKTQEELIRDNKLALEHTTHLIRELFDLSQKMFIRGSKLDDLRSRAITINSLINTQEYKLEIKGTFNAKAKGKRKQTSRKVV